MKIFALVIALFSLSLSACAQGQPQLTDEQKKAVQEAVFTTLDGKKVTIADFKGKVVLLDFWETWCGPCLRFMPTLSKVQNDFKDDFVAVAVSPGWSDSPDKVKAFVNEKNYGFTHVFGKDIATKLNISGIPYKVYIAADGTVLKAQMGISGNAERDYQEIAEVIKKHKATK